MLDKSKFLTIYIVFLSLAIEMSNVCFAVEKIYPNCDFNEINLCQQKGAGGHSSSIFSTNDGYCAKKIRNHSSLKEVEFYQFIEKECKKDDSEFRDLCMFIPKFGGMCTYGGQVFCKIENLKQSTRNSEYMLNPWALDLKLGTRTVSKASMSRSDLNLPSQMFWDKVSFLIDNYLTSSSEAGYRFAGLSRGKEYSEENIHHREGFTPFVLSPKLALKSFVSQKKKSPISQCLYNRISALEEAVSQKSFDRFHLVGSSILLIYDYDLEEANIDDCKVYLIDFANSFIVNESENNFEWLKRNEIFSKGFKKGVFQLLYDFSMLQ